MAGDDGPGCITCKKEDGTIVIKEYEYTGEDPDLACRRLGPYDSGTWAFCPVTVYPEEN